MDQLTRAREQFPGLERKLFFDSACVGLAPRCAADAVRKLLDATLRCPRRSATLHHLALDQECSRARAEAARLLHAREEEIALVESTTRALNLVAEALPLERGDRVLLCNLEFLQVALPWCQQRGRAGVEIDVVPHRRGEVRLEDIAGRFTRKTKVVAISSVQWSNGFRADLEGLGRLCRERGAWLVVDAIQQLGAIPLDVRRTPVDVVACGGHKWLNAPFGLGLLYVRRRALRDLRFPLAGYLSLETPEAGWANYFETPAITPVRNYRFVNHARRLEAGGTANYPGAVGLAASLKLIRQIGPDRISRRIHELTGRLMAGLERLGLELVTSPAPEHRSGIVTFSAGSPGRNVALMQYLLDRRVLVSVRYTSKVGGVRVSCHFYNVAEDVDRLLDHVRGFLRGR